MISQEQANKLFEYKDGKLYWKNAVRPSFNGKEAGYNNGNGYRKVTIDNEQFYVHRIIYVMHYGNCPDVIDHADRNPSNNKIENLRAADRSKNGMNSKSARTPNSGCRNVIYKAKANKFCVYMRINKKSKFIGSFDNLELADFVAQEVREKYHGKFAFSEAK